MKERIVWLDYVRAFSILLVVLTHALEGVYDLSAEAVLSNSFISKLFLFGGFNLTRHGVPLFLMISGYLLLSRNYSLSPSKELADGKKVYTCFDFWKKNLLNLIITFEIWVIIYNIFFLIVDDKEIKLVNLIRQMLFLDGVGLSHEWYLYMIVGMYIFLPFVAFILNNTDLKYLALPFLTTVILYFVLPSLSNVFSTSVTIWPTEKLGSSDIFSRVELYFAGGTYGIYLICGYLAKRKVFVKIKTVYLVLTAATFFTLGTAFEWQSYILGKPYIIWYNFFTLLPASIAIFEIFSRINFKKGFITKAVIGISKASFGIYLIHNLMLRIAFRFLPFSFKLPVNTLIYCAIAFFSGWFVIWAVSKIPVIGKYISFM